MLAHLLLQHGGNLREFLKLLSNQLEADGLPPYADPEAAPVEGAEIYVEFVYLRDIWDGFNLRHPNDSPEGHYPSGRRDSALYDELFRPPEHRVWQVELQDFLFRQVLGWGVQQVYIARSSRPVIVPGEHGKAMKVPVLSWKRVYERLIAPTHSPL